MQSCKYLMLSTYISASLSYLIQHIKLPPLLVRLQVSPPHLPPNPPLTILSFAPIYPLPTLTLPDPNSNPNPNQSCLSAFSAIAIIILLLFFVQSSFFSTFLCSFIWIYRNLKTTSVLFYSSLSFSYWFCMFLFIISIIFDPSIPSCSILFSIS